MVPRAIVRVDNKREPDAMQASLQPSPFESVAIDDQPALQRFLGGLRALRRLRANPGDTEQALAAAVLLNAGRFPAILAGFEASAEGREVLRARPALDCEHVDLAALARLPAGTLGQAYSAFLTSRNLTPEVFVPPRDVRDENVRYLSQRMRQTHDLWHVLTGYDTDVLGEIELQAFMYAQLGTPFSLLVAVLGMSRARPRTLSLPRRVWNAYARGKRAEQLAWRFWERHFTTPVADLRRVLKLAD
jgi:ubiquinone biosynthesis protein COQ4